MQRAMWRCHGINCVAIVSCDDHYTDMCWHFLYTQYYSSMKNCTHFPIVSRSSLCTYPSQGHFLNLSKHRWSVCLHSKVRFFNILPFDTRNNCFLKIIDLRTLYQNSEAWQLCHGMAKENMLICGGKLDKLIKRCNNHVFEYILNNSPEMVYNFISAIIIYQLTS